MNHDVIAVLTARFRRFSRMSLQRASKRWFLAGAGAITGVGITNKMMLRCLCACEKLCFCGSKCRATVSLYFRGILNNIMKLVKSAAMD